MNFSTSSYTPARAPKRSNIISSSPFISRYAAPSQISTPSPSRSRPNLGYLAFPPDSPIFSPQPPSNTEEENQQQARAQTAEQERARQVRLEEEYAARLARDAAVRQKRLAQEEAEARRGEEDWVRSGGILRDAQGNRDWVKTNAIREELRIREVERVLNEKWERYQKRWRDLTGKNAEEGPIEFQDIPWPVDVEPGKEVHLSDLTADRIEDFLLGTLKVRGSAVTRKERVRASLLRWHPDKMTGILARVIDEDTEAIQQGINVVVRCLHQLNVRQE